jgi:hypothetical protein
VIRSVIDLLAVIDEFEAPDQWNEIVARVDERTDISLVASPGLASLEVELFEPMNREREERTMSRIFIVVVAAAAVLIGVMVALLLRPSDDKESPVIVDRPAPTTTERRSDSNASVEAALAMVDAYNAGRLDEFMSFFSPSATFYGGRPREEQRAAAAAFMAAQDQWTLTDCAPSATNTVTCASTRRDDFHGAAGLVLTEDLQFVFDTDGRIFAYGTHRDVVYADYLIFGQKFLSWLRTAHPDVAVSYDSFLSEGDVLSAMPTAEDMPTALEFVNEFVLNDRVDDLSAMVDAYNAGRFDEYMSFFSPAAQFYGGRPLAEHYLAAAAFIAANDQWTLTDCALSATNTVACASTKRDDFHGAGGLILTENLQLVFDTDGRISAYGSDADVHADYFSFGREFRSWLRVAHPDVTASYDSFLYDAGPLSMMPTAEDVPTALEYVNEFVNQSLDYPVAP